LYIPEIKKKRARTKGKWRVDGFIFGTAGCGGSREKTTKELMTL